MKFNYKNESELFSILHEIFNQNLNTKVSLVNLDVIVKQLVFEDISYNQAVNQIEKLKNLKRYNLNLSF